MSFLRRFPLLAYTLVFLSLLAFNYAAENYGLMAFSLTALLLSWRLVETGKGPPVPRWIINTGVLLVALALFWELVIYKQNNLLLALGHFMVGLIICKLFEKKTNRDYGQILLLSLLLILSGAILTVSPIYAILLLIYLGLGLYTSLVFHLQCETQRAMQRHAAGDRMMIMPGQQSVMARDMRRISIGAGIFLFVFACVIFVLFPRTGMPGMLADWRIGGPTATGLTNHIQLGRFGQLQQSNAVVAEVTITQDGQNIGSQGYQPYFMSSTQNFYNARTHEWFHARTGGWWRPLPGPPAPRPIGPYPIAEMLPGRLSRPTPTRPPSSSTMPGILPPGMPAPGAPGSSAVMTWPGARLQRKMRRYGPALLRQQALRRHMIMRLHPFNRSIIVRRATPTLLVPPGSFSNGGLITQTYTFNHARPGPLLAICPAVTLSSPDLREITHRGDGTIIADPIHGHLTYTVQSPLKYSPTLIGPKKPAVFPDMFRFPAFGYLSTPEKMRSAPIPPRVVALARKIAGPLLKMNRTGANAQKVDMLLADKFCNYLRKTYPYSFDMTPVNQTIDPTEDFLFNKKKIGGYCEYFASAMVMLCRSVHIPARMVSGFHGGSYNPVGGYYVIKEKYAHAWVQAWIPRLGWVMFDPSPAGSLTSVQTKMTWWTEVLDFFQWLRLKWLHNIITFNQAMRAAIINHVMIFAKAVMLTIAHFARVLGHGMARLFKNWTLHLWMRILLGIAAAGLIPLGYLVYARWKRRNLIAVQAVRSMDPKVQRRMVRELAFIDRLMKVLQRTGVNREPDQTPREYVQTVGHKTGLQLPEALQMVRVFYEVRFGSGRMSPQL
ncbi:MAG: transglutaminase TgpA family protein, partial [Phycisphaerae bacterium]